MAQVSITGTIKVIGKTQEISEKFRKRECVITESGGQYPAHIPVEFTQDSCSLVDGFKEGEEVTVTAFVNGREWSGKDGVTKYFLSLKGNRIERVGAAGNGAPPRSAPAHTAADMPPVGGDEDDLPF